MGTVDLEQNKFELHGNTGGFFSYIGNFFGDSQHLKNILFSLAYFIVGIHMTHKIYVR